MFSNINFSSLKPVLIGGAVIGGLATVGYYTYKYVTSTDKPNNINLDGKFGHYDDLLDADERARRVAKLVRRKAIIDPKTAFCVIKENGQWPTQEINQDKDAEMIEQANDKREENVQTDIHDQNAQNNEETRPTVKRDESQRDIIENHDKKENGGAIHYKVQSETTSQAVEQTDDEGEGGDELDTEKRGKIEDKQLVNELKIQEDEETMKSEIKEILKDKEERREVDEEESENKESQDKKDKQKLNEQINEKVPQEDEKGEEQNPNDVPQPLDSEASSLSDWTYHSGPMPGMYIPNILKNVKTMKDFEQTMEALCVFLFKQKRTQQELDEAKRELGWVFNLAKGFLHILPADIPDFNAAESEMQTVD